MGVIIDNELSSRTVIVGHPDTLLAEGIAAILSKHSFTVFGTAVTAHDLDDLVTGNQPDLIILDPQLCNSPVDLINRLHQNSPDSILALLSKKGNLVDIAGIIEAGASGCISVDVTSEEFIRDLQALLSGDVLFSRDMIDDVRKQLNERLKSRPIETLSDREREVLGHIGDGLNNRQIARRLYISENTVKVHVRGILSKLDLKNRQQAAVYASKEGLTNSTENPEVAAKSE